MHKRLLVAFVLAVFISAAALAVIGLVLGRHKVIVKPGPSTLLNFNGTTVVEAAPYSMHTAAEPMRVAGKQMSPCVQYTVSIKAEGLERYKYFVVLVAGNSSVGLYADPAHPVASATLCSDKVPVGIAMARSVVIDAGRDGGRLEATMSAKAVDPRKARPDYWPAWAFPGAYVVYDAFVARLKARVVDAGPGYAIVEQQASDTLGLGLINVTRLKVNFDEASSEIVFYTRATLEKLIKDSKTQGCSITYTRVDAAGRRGLEALEIKCKDHTLYISPQYGLLLRAYGAGIAVELKDTNILPVPQPASHQGEHLLVSTKSTVYRNGTVVLVIEAKQKTRLVKIEICDHKLPGAILAPGLNTLRLQLPEPLHGETCLVKLYTEKGNLVTATIKVRNH